MREFEQTWEEKSRGRGRLDTHRLGTSPRSFAHPKAMYHWNPHLLDTGPPWLMSRLILVTHKLVSGDLTTKDGGTAPTTTTTTTTTTTQQQSKSHAPDSDSY
mmetsp:Transcript_14088/g.31166  ORF Transcript_14088/g.31166 Transcript_14088/m.31166 type:complete len:102 (-) Transcript_14088:1315-1620(-)